MSFKKIYKKAINLVDRYAEKITHKKRKKRNSVEIKILESIWSSSYNNLFFSSSQNKSVWFAEHSSYQSYINDEMLQELTKIAEVEFAKLAYFQSKIYTAYCEICSSVKEMGISLKYGATEDISCLSCAQSARVRAMYEFIKRLGPISSRIYMDEAVTKSFKSFKELFGDLLVGAEFLGSDKIGGKIYNGIMHQDSTNLALENNSFGLIISQHVFEHIYEYKKALREYQRVLLEDGVLAISIPFFINNKETVMRAQLLEDGKINHLLPQEIHGNPLLSSGALAFYNHGWEFIDVLKDIGFRDVKVNFYYSPYKGYLTVQNIISAIK